MGNYNKVDTIDGYIRLDCLELGPAGPLNCYSHCHGLSTMLLKPRVLYT